MRNAVVVFCAFMIGMFYFCISEYAYARDIKSSSDPFRGDISLEERGWINLSVYGAGAFTELFKDVDDIEYENDLFVSGRLTYDITPYIEVGIEGGHMKLDVDELNFNTNLVAYMTNNAGEIDAVTVMGIMVVKYPIKSTENKLVPYGLIGAGGIFMDFDEGNGLTAPPATIDDDASFAIKAGAGVDYYLTEKAAVFLEGSYFWSDYDPDVSVVGGGTGTLDADINALFVGGGLKFSF